MEVYVHRRERLKDLLREFSAADIAARSGIAASTISRYKKEPGEKGAKNISAHAPEVRRLIKAGDDDAAAGLLLRLIDAIEREAAHPLPGHDAIPPWFFDQLGAIYRRAGMAREAALLKQRMTVLQIRAQTAAALAARAPAPAAQDNPAQEGGRALGALVGLVVRKARDLLR